MAVFQENVYQYFRKEIEELGNIKIKKLESEIEAIKTKQMKQLQEEIDDTITRAKENELNELNQELSAALNRIKVGNHLEIIKIKHGLLESVLLEVKAKLLKFVKTDEYKEKMVFLIKKIDKDFCGNKILFKIKPGDNIIKKIIESNYKNKLIIEEDELITIGGFKAVCLDKGILTDQTLDSSLEDRKEWFYKNSKLAIEE